MDFFGNQQALAIKNVSSEIQIKSDNLKHAQKIFVTKKFSIVKKFIIFLFSFRPEFRYAVTKKFGKMILERAMDFTGDFETFYHYVIATNEAEQGKKIFRKNFGILNAIALAAKKSKNKRQESKSRIKMNRKKIGFNEIFKTLFLVSEFDAVRKISMKYNYENAKKLTNACTVNRCILIKYAVFHFLQTTIRDWVNVFKKKFENSEFKTKDFNVLSIHVTKKIILAMRFFVTQGQIVGNENGSKYQKSGKNNSELDELGENDDLPALPPGDQASELVGDAENTTTTIEKSNWRPTFRLNTDEAKLPDVDMKVFEDRLRTRLDASPWGCFLHVFCC